MLLTIETMSLAPKKIFLMVNSEMYVTANEVVDVLTNTREYFEHNVEETSLYCETIKVSESFGF